MGGAPARRSLTRRIPRRRTPHVRRSACLTRKPWPTADSIRYSDVVLIDNRCLVNPWAQAAISALIGLSAAAGALFGVLRSVRGNDRATQQRELAGRREEWWRRFVWAAELTFDQSQDKRV